MGKMKSHTMPDGSRMKGAKHEKGEYAGMKAVEHRRSYSSKEGKSTKGNSKMC